MTAIINDDDVDLHLYSRNDFIIEQIKKHIIKLSMHIETTLEGHT